MVVVDESFFEYSGFSAVEMTKKFSNLTVMRSFSHAFGLGALKVAYAITDPENLDYIRRLEPESGIDAVSQIAAQAVLDDLDYMREYTDEVDRSRKILSSSLTEIGYEFHISPANFVILRVTDSALAVDFMKDNGMKVRDLSEIKQMQDYIRITIGVPRQTDNLLLLLSRMAEQFATGFNRNKAERSADRLQEAVPAGGSAK